MIREIEFRFWDAKGKAMYDTVQIATLSGAAMGLSYLIKQLDELGWILLQYTGRKDVNERKIFEGDLVQDISGGRKYEVKWWGSHARWAAHEIGTGRMFGLYALKVKVVGNVYEGETEITKDNKIQSRIRQAE